MEQSVKRVIQQGMVRMDNGEDDSFLLSTCVCVCDTKTRDCAKFEKNTIESKPNVTQRSAVLRDATEWMVSRCKQRQPFHDRSDFIFQKVSILTTDGTLCRTGTLLSIGLVRRRRTHIAFSLSLDCGIVLALNQ